MCDGWGRRGSERTESKYTRDRYRAPGTARTEGGEQLLEFARVAPGFRNLLPNSGTPTGMLDPLSPTSVASTALAEMLFRNPLGAARTVGPGVAVGTGLGVGGAGLLD